MLYVYVITKEDCCEDPEWGRGFQRREFDNCSNNIFLFKEDALKAMQKQASTDKDLIFTDRSLETILDDEGEIIGLQLIDPYNPDDNWIEYRIVDREVQGS